MAETDDKKNARARWRAMESNPDALKEFCVRMGMRDTWAFSDVFSLEPDTLSWVPQPCIALIFLFPCETREQTNKVQAEAIAAARKGKTEPYFIRQLPNLGNACGTIAMLHALANKRSELGIDSASLLVKFMEKTKSMSGLERCDALDADEEVRGTHTEVASSETHNQTKATDGQVEHHFVCFCEIDGDLYEIDGTRESPINYGPLGEESMLSKAATVIREGYVAHNPDLLFSLLALAPQQD